MSDYYLWQIDLQNVDPKNIFLSENVSSRMQGVSDRSENRTAGFEGVNTGPFSFEELWVFTKQKVILKETGAGWV